MANTGVEITIRLSASAVRLLLANVVVFGGPTAECMRDGNGFARQDVDVRGALAMLVLGEARGAPIEDTMATLPAMWCEDFTIVEGGRKVITE